MNSNNHSVAPWFKGSFYFGIAFSLLAIGSLIFEIVKNGNWFVESLLGHLGMGLLFLYFSGRPMADERIRYLKFKSLSIAFVITAVLGNLANYLVTYPDGHQNGGFSSYWSVLVCMVLAFVGFGILKSRE